MCCQTGGPYSRKKYRRTSVRRQKLHSNNSGLIALDEKRFTPTNIEARQSASGARSRSYTRGSEVGDRCRPSL